MAAELFRSGTTHIVNGITCERIVVEPSTFQRLLLEEEWFLTPEECYPEELEDVNRDNQS